MRYNRSPLLVIAFLTAVACNRDRTSAQAVDDESGSARRVTVIAPSGGAYREMSVTDGGRVTGTVGFTGVPQGDTIVIIPAEQNGCGKPLTIQRLVRHAGKVSGVLVWLSDIRAGRPIPMARRYQLENSDCSWSTTMQVAMAGGTLNVANYDPLVERAYATSVATGDTVAVAPFTDDGEVIPYDRQLAKPHVLEFSVESRPASRAWVAVLDQPYYAITDDSGSFSIDDIPPGTYHIRSWHPMLGVSDGTVTVLANRTTTATITFSSPSPVPARTTP